jgi:hypothetical protein
LSRSSYDSTSPDIYSKLIFPGAPTSRSHCWVSTQCFFIYSSSCHIGGKGLPPGLSTDEAEAHYVLEMLRKKGCRTTTQVLEFWSFTITNCKLKLVLSLFKRLSIFANIISYAYSEVHRLSLPISQILALFAAFLPIATGISLQSAHHLLRIHAKNLGLTRPTLCVILLIAFQLIYETVVATLALTHMAPPSSLNCGLEEQWKRLWMSKDEAAIKRIQNRFDCCGFNSVLDRAWPVPGKEVGVGECQKRFDRTQSCAGPWRQAEQINAGLLFTVAAVIFVIKVCSLCTQNRPHVDQHQLFALTYFFTNSTNSTTIPWFLSPPFKRITAGEEGRRLIEEGEPQQEYHDEAEVNSGNAGDEGAVTSNINTNGSRPRIEPSGLLGPGEGWRDEH